MVENIVLLLMQVKGISRKKIYKYFQLKSGEYSLEDVQMMIKEAALDSSQITVPSLSELDVAYKKYKEIVDNSEELGIKIISYLDDEFPIKLRKINDPPAVVYALGNIECLNEKAIAVIGTREPTEYGAKIADNLGFVLGRDGYTVVSGLAHGCDRYGHEGCLRAEGNTVAVMAGGLDKVYPAQHKELAKKIVETGGCLLSEYPVKSGTFRNNFIERDRLQSGLSEGIIVVETDVTGGTWHTIRYAKNYKRKIGCYVHPEKYLSEKMTLGIQKLLKEEEIIAIETNDDLNDYKKLIDDSHMALMKNENILRTTQLSFIEQIGG